MESDGSVIVTGVGIRAPLAERAQRRRGRGSVADFRRLAAPLYVTAHTYLCRRLPAQDERRALGLSRPGVRLRCRGPLGPLRAVVARSRRAQAYCR
jgi:hypothetical protein